MENSWRKIQNDRCGKETVEKAVDRTGQAVKGSTGPGIVHALELNAKLAPSKTRATITKL
jgi:hypothetical protein